MSPVMDFVLIAFAKNANLRDVKSEVKKVLFMKSGKRNF